MPGMLPGMSAAKPIPLLVPAPAAPQAQPVRRQPVGRAVSTIVLHCSATPSGRWIAGAPATVGFTPAVKAIDNWHAQRGFKRDPAAAHAYNPDLPHIGYHRVIDLNGGVYTGRHLAEPGAHVAGFNARTVGVCLVGGAERDARYTAAQWAALALLVRTLATQLGLLLVYPLNPRLGGGVCGHRDLSPDTNNDGSITPGEWLKTCPGFDVGAWLGRGLQPRPEQVCEVRE